MTELSSAQIGQRLQAKLSAVTGSDIDILQVRALSGGAASMSYAVEASREGRDWPLVLQCSSEGSGDAESSRTMTRAVQAALQQRVGAHGVAVPDIVAVLEPDDGLGKGFVMAFVRGETLAPRYLRKLEFAAARDALMSDTASALAHLHAIPASEFADLALPTLDGPAQLASLIELYDSLGGDVPVFEMAFALLKQRLKPCADPVLVHGDYRSGNFIVGERGLASVLDWELAHIGDPWLDIGWLSTNTWRFGNWRQPVGGFGQREDFYQAYEAAGGRSVDRDAVLAFEMLGSLRWGVMCLQMSAKADSGDMISVERAAIGRRVSETEADLLHIMQHGSV
ncbi:MAG: phosphotransferase family protein [Pacificimonas sp.]